MCGWADPSINPRWSGIPLQSVGGGEQWRPVNGLVDGLPTEELLSPLPQQSGPWSGRTRGTCHCVECRWSNRSGGGGGVQINFMTG